jgi:hypothetical protein
MSEEAGADHVIVDTEGRFAEQVLHLTGGEGVHVVYDGSGPKTFRGSLDLLRRSGTFCWYGPVLGGPGPLDIISLPKSIKIGYATFLDHIHTLSCFARARRSCLTGSRTGGSGSGLAAGIRWRMRRRPTPTWRAARPPASCCSSHERRGRPQGRDCLRRVARHRRGHRLAPRRSLRQRALSC